MEAQSRSCVHRCSWLRYGRIRYRPDRTNRTTHYHQASGEKTRVKRHAKLMKTQNIDENFSKIHNALANKILPAVKRYAVGTEPVREAAKVRDFLNLLKYC